MNLNNATVEDLLVVLRYTQEKRSQSTVRRYYLRWRDMKGIPERCDNPQCPFHTRELIWAGEKLRLILDHVDGVNSDNRPHSLRLLCPNCDAQLPTKGGKNKGRVGKSSGGFYVTDENGLRHHMLPVETAHFVIRV